MNNNLYFKEKKIQDFNDILTCFSKSEFYSPYRSSIPMLIFFKQNKHINLPGFNTVNAESVTYIFEHETPVLKGIGKASCTDLMILSDKTSITIEAKRTEPKYPTVKKWLEQSDNKKLVLEGWLFAINDYAKTKIEIDDILDFPYQFIHRVASACFTKKKKVYVVYLGFNLKEKMEVYYTKYIDLFSKMTNNKIILSLVNSRIVKKEEQLKLEEMWIKGCRDLSERVIEGIKNDTLMSFNTRL